MVEYVVRNKAHEYIHDFSVGSKWLGSDCHAVAEKVRWTDTQGLAFRWSDRNAAASTARDVGGKVVRLRPKAPFTSSGNAVRYVDPGDGEGPARLDTVGMSRTGAP